MCTYAMVLLQIQWFEVLRLLKEMNNIQLDKEK